MNECIHKSPVTEIVGYSVVGCYTDMGLSFWVSPRYMLAKQWLQALKVKLHPKALNDSGTRKAT